MTPTGGQPSGSDRVIVIPGVFAGMIGILSLGIAFSFGSKIALGNVGPLILALGLAALASAIAAWILFFRLGRTAVGQRAILFLTFLAMAFVNTDILGSASTAPVYRASAAMWWVVAAAFGFEWWRYKRRRDGED